MRRLLGLAFVFLLAGCRHQAAPVHDGPIVVITFDSLRADAVEGLGGDKGLTPNLDALIRQADWSGRAIASSSWGMPSMASLFTGLHPWQHQVLRVEDRLAPALVTLPEALKAQGYETFGFLGEAMYSQEAGFGQGFDLLTRLGKGTEAGQKLRSSGSAGDGRRFVWVHFSEPQAPYYRRPKFAARLGLRGRDLPSRILPHQLAPFFDPAVPLPPELEQRFRTLYRLNVAWADDRLGRLLEELRASGQWDRTLLVVTSTHGEEFGEKGQILNGGNLGRQLIEVPLVIKLPSKSGLKIAVPRDQRVATARLWATLVEAAGGEVPPAQAPSLLRLTPGGAILSELYLVNGTNRFSLVQGNDQLLWETRFAPPEPEYYRARLALMSRGNARIARAELSERPGLIFRRLLTRFRETPPLTGGAGRDGACRLTLERWEGKGSHLISDPQRQAEMARILARTWNDFLPDERTPGAEAREWYNPESP